MRDRALLQKFMATTPIQQTGSTATPTTAPQQAQPKPATVAFPTPEVVKKVCVDADINNIKKNLPYILKEMAAGGLTSKNDLIAVICTIAVETASFASIEEIGKGGGRHGNYYGRGFVQITWETNYRACGKAIGIDLVGNPALALKPDIAAKALVWFFKTNKIPSYAAKGDFDNVRSIVNSGSPGNIGICWGVPQYRAAVARAKQHFTQGIDPNAVGAIPLDGSYGLGCIDTGGAGSKTFSAQHNPSTQADALAYALGLHEAERQRSHEFEAMVQLASDPSILKLDAQKTFELKGFAPDLDGTFTTEEIIFYPLDPRGLVASLHAYKPDPNAPKPQVFLHDANVGLKPPDPVMAPSNVTPDGWRWAMPPNDVNVAGMKCEFGYARNRLHAGIDLGGYGKDDVFAASSGTVDFTCEIGGAGGYGRMIDIKHPNGWMTRYAHLKQVLVKKGDTVQGGQKIGIRGGSGARSDNDYPYHLHFEVHNPSGKPVDPRSVMPKPGPPRV